MIEVKSSGSFKNAESFLGRILRDDVAKSLEQYGEEGVLALSNATPVDTGLTANSWGYVVDRSHGSYSITWVNNNTSTGVNVAIILQYGHATGTGGWVEGYDYINPVIQPLFDRIADDIWKEVTRV